MDKSASQINYLKLNKYYDLWTEDKLYTISTHSNPTTAYLQEFSNAYSQKKRYVLQFTFFLKLLRCIFEIFDGFGF